jgi:2-hydroxychromene-2-carboxylate isomerase
MQMVRFYFDFISPYAYLASTQLDGIAARTQVTIERVPVLFAALLDAHGQKGPAEIPAKRRYTWKDVSRKCHAAGVPIAPPPSHPFNPLLGLRVASLPELDEGDARARATRRPGCGAKASSAPTRWRRRSTAPGSTAKRSSRAPATRR